MNGEVLPLTDAGHVYLVTNPTMLPGFVKIGMTTRDVRERVAELDDEGAPEAYTLVASWPVEHARDAERAAHDALARWHVRKEWYRVAPDRAVRRLNGVLSPDRAVRMRTRLFCPWPLRVANAAAAGIGWTVIFALLLAALGR